MENKLTSEVRILNFRKDIIDGPNFVCSSCKRGLFKSSVKYLDKAAICALKTKHKLDNGFFRELGISNNCCLTLCHNCLRHIKKKKVPSINEQNGLILEDIPEELKLKDIEQQLLARTLLFIKIKKLPKSQMRAMKDKIINVPLEDEDISKNMTNLLPRHPDDAHLMCVQLKRKIEMKNSHIAGFIRPNIVIKALETLKQRGNKYYQDVIINENFLEKEEHSTEDEVEDMEIENEVEDMEVETESQILEREKDEAWELEDKRKEEERQTNGVSDSEDEDDTNLKSVKKYQSKQCNNTFLLPDDLTNELVENKGQTHITKTTKGNGNIAVAPGEGKIPTNLLREEDFDVKAFPRHHPCGQYGLHHQRKYKLTAQMYFNQRLMNQDERFAKDPCYLFMACYYLERQQIESQINIAGIKGLSRLNANGERKIHLNDLYSVFSKVKGTPKYWQTARNDLVAKVKQLGPFHIFYTFSCGETRWAEVFLCILYRNGYKIEIPEDWDGHEEDLLVEGKNLKDFINEDMSKSKHKLFEDYTLLITLLFDARVKSFVKNILMAGGKDKIPFKYYSYRVEFQARGMPHIHGVAWISPDYLAKEEINGHLCDIDESKLIDLVKSLVSCSLPEPEEDKELAEIVGSVQKHGHTKSCLKYNGKCRYGFPKLPSNKTFVAKPVDENLDPEKKRKLLEDAKTTLQGALTLLDQPDLGVDEKMSFEEFVEKVGQQIGKELTPEVYMKHIGITERGKTIILKREVKERFVNNYNKEMITAWNANMDIQLALDPFAVITYIVNYVNKDETGLTKFMKEALTKLPANEDTREKLRALKTTYLTHRQIGASEAVYRVIPNMKLKDSNIKCVFVASGFPDNRSCFYLKVNEESTEELEIDEDEDEDDYEDENEDDEYESEDEDSNDEEMDNKPTRNPVQIEGRAGMFKKSISIIERYAARPKYLRTMCLAQFATSYTYQAKPPKKVKFDKNGNSRGRSSKKIFNQDIFLPTHIALKDGLGIMRLRKEPAVLRIHTSKRKDGHEKHYSEMVLFSPWMNEEKELPQDEDACIEEYIKRRDDINTNREAIYPGEATIDLLEGEELELKRPTHLVEMLDNQGDQENADDLEEGAVDDPDFETFAYTGNLNLDEHPNKFEDFKYKELCVPDEFELQQMTRQLVPEQMNVMRTVLSSCRDIVKAEKYPQIKRKPVRRIVHGGAGVGKSQTIKVLAMQAEKTLRKPGHHPNRPRVLLAAFTGKAASLIGKFKMK